MNLVSCSSHSEQKEASIYANLPPSSINVLSDKTLWQRALINDIYSASMSDEEASTSADQLDRREAQMFFFATSGPWKQHRDWVFEEVLEMDNYANALSKIQDIITHKARPQELSLFIKPPKRGPKKKEKV